MSGRRRSLVRGAAAAASALTLVATGLAAAPFASAASSGTTLNVAITSNGLYVNGPTTFPAGRVKLYVDAAGSDRGAAIVLLAPGYSFHDLRHDVKVLGQNLFAPGGDKDKGLKAENHFIKNTTIVGGLYAPKGKVRHGTVLVTEAGGHYVLFDDSGNVPKRAVDLTVTSPSGSQDLNDTNKKIKATTDRRWKGDTVLPANGTITIKNKSTQSPHFMDLEQVKKGTTRKDIINAFSGSGSDPFVHGGGTAASDILHMGQKMTLHLNVKPGTYALMCFFPDPKTGRDHASMGMIRVVTLKG